MWIRKGRKTKWHWAWDKAHAQPWTTLCGRTLVAPERLSPLKVDGPCCAKCAEELAKDAGLSDNAKPATSKRPPKKSVRLLRRTWPFEDDP